MKKVYIAAPSESQAIVKEMAYLLRQNGITITARWIHEDFKTQNTPALLREWAIKDLEDVAAADILLAFNSEEFRHKGTGGRHVELGYAIALGKPILLYGARTNVFHHHPQVIELEDGENLLEALQRVIVVE